MLQEHESGGGQLDAADAAGHQRDADLVLQIADLAAQRRLRRVQNLLGRDRQAARLGDRDEIAEMPQLHILSHTC